MTMLFDEREELQEYDDDKCRECGGWIIRAEPVLIDRQSVGCEDGHYVCSRCGLVTEKVLNKVPRNFSPIDREYLAMMPWGQTEAEKMGGLTTHENARDIIKAGLRREPKMARLKA